ncbi:unnamed protein product, partial [Mesorhabditis spiculigera]
MVDAEKRNEPRRTHDVVLERNQRLLFDEEGIHHFCVKGGATTRIVCKRSAVKSINYQPLRHTIDIDTGRGLKPFKTCRALGVAHIKAAVEGACRAFGYILVEKAPSKPPSAVPGDALFDSPRSAKERSAPIRGRTASPERAGTDFGSVIGLKSPSPTRTMQARPERGLTPQNGNKRSYMDTVLKPTSIQEEIRSSTPPRWNVFDKENQRPDLNKIKNKIGNPSYLSLKPNLHSPLQKSFLPEIREERQREPRKITTAQSPKTTKNPTKTLARFNKYSKVTSAYYVDAAARAVCERSKGDIILRIAATIPSDRRATAKKELAQPDKRPRIATSPVPSHQFDYKGLVNPHNHCYLNSVLQIVCTRPLFASRVLAAIGMVGSEAPNHLSPIFHTLEELCTRLPMSPKQAAIFHNNLSPVRVEELSNLLDYLGKNYCNTFLENNGRAQHDAQELYGCLIDALYEQCEGKRPKNFLATKADDSIAENTKSELVTALESAEASADVDESKVDDVATQDSDEVPDSQEPPPPTPHAVDPNIDQTAIEPSVATSPQLSDGPIAKRISTGAPILSGALNPAKLFQFEHVTSKTCAACGKARASEVAPDWHLMLPIPTSGVYDPEKEKLPVQYLLDRKFAEEEIEVKCETCNGTDNVHIAKLRLREFPTYLMLMIVRYNGGMNRLPHELIINETINMSRYLDEGPAPKQRTIVDLDGTDDRFSVGSQQNSPADFSDEEVTPTCAKRKRTDDSFNMFSEDDDGAGKETQKRARYDKPGEKSPSTDPPTREELIKSFAAFCIPKFDDLWEEWTSKCFAEPGNGVVGISTPEGMATYTFRPPPSLFYTNVSRAFNCFGSTEALRSELGATKCFAPTDQVVETKSIDGDGNCLFRALSYWIAGKEDMYRRVRKILCAFLRLHSKSFEGFLTPHETMEDHLTAMEADAAWGGQTELAAAATLFSINIFTLVEKRWRVFRPLFKWDRTQNITSLKLTDHTHHAFYLINQYSCHFDVITDIKTATGKPEHMYTLVGVANHSGRSLQSGHYTAAVRQLLPKSSGELAETWLTCNDEYINVENDLQAALNARNSPRNAYLLLYRRGDITAEGESEELEQYVKEHSGC